MLWNPRLGGAHVGGAACTGAGAGLSRVSRSALSACPPAPRGRMGRVRLRVTHDRWDDGHAFLQPSPRPRLSGAARMHASQARSRPTHRMRPHGSVGISFRPCLLSSLAFGRQPSMACRPSGSSRRVGDAQGFRRRSPGLFAGAPSDAYRAGVAFSWLDGSGPAAGATQPPRCRSVGRRGRCCGRWR